MSFLLSVPYLVRIICSLAAILVFQKITKSLAVAMALGVAILALWTGQTPAAIASITGDRVLSVDTFFIALSIAAIMWLSTLMSEAGVMRDLVTSLRTRLPHRALLAALPAVVGLLPMPAGALFSAPLVADADLYKNLAPGLKGRINYWFRHVWEFFWPLYPGVLLAIDLVGLPVWKFLALLFPLFLVAVLGGHLFILRRVPVGPRMERRNNDKAFLPLVLPIVSILVVYTVLQLTVPAIGRFDRYLPMAIGVVVGLVILQCQRQLTPAAWKRAIFSWRAVSLLCLIILTRVYGAFVEARLPDGVPLMEKVKVELNTYGIPVLALIIVLPLVSGLTTGITVGYIGASFPVILSLAGENPGSLYSVVVLGYASGFVGMMLSPIHVCLIVNNEYFQTKLSESLGGLLRPCLVVFSCAAAYSAFWYAVR